MYAFKERENGFIILHCVAWHGISWYNFSVIWEFSS
jgi:hypothetical protein